MFSLVLTSAYGYNMNGGFGNPTYTSSYYSSNVRTPYVNVGRYYVDVRNRYADVSYSRNIYGRTVSVNVGRNNNLGWLTSLFVLGSNYNRNYDRSYYYDDYYYDDYDNNYYYDDYYDDGWDSGRDYSYYSSSYGRYYDDVCYTSPPKGKLFYKRC